MNAKMSDLKSVSVEMFKVEQNVPSKRFDEMKESLSLSDLTLQSVLGVVRDAMLLAKDYSELQGRQKKSLVMDVVSHMISESNLNEANKVAASLILQASAPQYIDDLIDAEKGVFNFVQKVGCLAGLFCGKR